ncbi:hypothetical protein Bbelb_007550 [Branchiostoma belcheri]|nr:hypothetical protein Bbelb_007550 [Branchiostoma belcheri]
MKILSSSGASGGSDIRDGKRRISEGKAGRLISQGLTTEPEGWRREYGEGPPSRKAGGENNHITHGSMYSTGHEIRISFRGTFCEIPRYVLRYIAKRRAEYCGRPCGILRKAVRNIAEGRA